MSSKIPTLSSPSWWDASFVKTLVIYVIIVILVWWIISGVIDYILSYFPGSQRVYTCLSLTNLFNGQIGHCFDPPPEYCKDINIQMNYGYCADPDQLQVMTGDDSGAFDDQCDHWITNPKHCPPLQCQGQYPIGIKTDGQNPPVQQYGWCGDPEVNRALRGSKCGADPDEGITCRNWIWEESQCQQSCGRTKPKPKSGASGSCSLVCGVVNGKNVPCPPMCSGKEGKGESCPC